MATVTLTPNANSAVNNTGWPDNGTPDYTRVTTNDGDTTNIYTPSANSTITYPHTASGLTGTETINSVTVFSLLKPLDPNVGASTAEIIYIGGTIYVGTAQSRNDNTQYSSTSSVWTTNPNTGAAWTAANIAAMEIGIRKINTFGERCTQIYAVVDYTAGGAPSPSDIAATLQSSYNNNFFLG